MYIPLDLSSFESSKVAEFYSTGEEVNEYGEKVFGSSLIGSCYCLFIPDSTNVNPTRDGIIVADDAYIHYPSSMSFKPETTIVTVDGERYNVIWIQDGSLSTGMNYARLMRIVGTT